MTLYAGEMAKIIHTATKDGVSLLPEDITAVWLTIFNADREALGAEEAMTWDTDKLRWQYLWNTVDVEAGTYRIKVRIAGVDGGSVWEYKRLRLARNPVSV